MAHLFVPIFFVTIGMTIHPRDAESLAPGGGLTLALALTAAGVASKLATGWVVYRRDVRRWPVGVGMVPREEVGLVFAGIGLAAGVIDDVLYSAAVVAVVLTTFLAPPWLKVRYRV